MMIAAFTQTIEKDNVWGGVTNTCLKLGFAKDTKRAKNKLSSQNGNT